MVEAFKAGGWGMLPTTVMGVLLLVAAVLYALRPERRRVPLLLCLSLLTLLSGFLGSLMGIIGTLAAAGRGEHDEPASVILMAGSAESLYVLALALVILCIALMVIADGALRVWRGRTD
jgi:formate hydrogenlyase subunit 3/multisubunit Na+/H+ antiporter MnhD subunit